MLSELILVTVYVDPRGGRAAGEKKGRKEGRDGMRMNHHLLPKSGISCGGCGGGGGNINGFRGSGRALLFIRCSM